jgi:hypothetical protein
MFVQAAVAKGRTMPFTMSPAGPSAMPSNSAWSELFENWPASLPRRGVVLSSLNESTPFKAFMVKGDALLLERTNPDPLGVRFVLLSFDAIHAVKFTDPLKESVFSAAGFLGKLSPA